MTTFWKVRGTERFAEAEIAVGKAAGREPTYRGYRKVLEAAEHKI